VEAGNVSEIASTDTGAIQGVFKKPVQVSGTSVTDFQTQVPAFADADALTDDLEAGHVTVTRARPTPAPGSCCRSCSASVPSSC
jgi:hypothetical protein